MFGARYFGAWYFGARYFGKVGEIPVNGAYNGARYFGKRYFGIRYWASQTDSNPFTVTQTNTLAMVGTILPSATGAFSYTADFPMAQVGSLSLTGTTSISASFLAEGSEFSFTPPLEGPALVGTIGVTGDFTTTVPAPGVGCYFGNRYFGSRYFAHRYFSPIIGFSLAQTADIGLTGSLLTAGGFTTEIGIAPTNVLAFSGIIGVAGDFTASTYVPPVVVDEENSGGWPIYFQQRKKKVSVPRETVVPVEEPQVVEARVTTETKPVSSTPFDFEQIVQAVEKRQKAREERHAKAVDAQLKALYAAEDYRKRLEAEQKEASYKSAEEARMAAEQMEVAKRKEQELLAEILLLAS